MIYLNPSEYEVIRKIGKGGQAEVYLVNDLRRKTREVLKICDLSNLSLKLKSNLITEALKLEEIQNDNIVKIVEYFKPRDDKDSFYIFLEYCEDGDLCKYIKKSKAKRQFLSDSLVLLWLKQITQGLHYCHSTNEQKQHPLIHDDLKPENILIKNGNCKITDFGCAKVQKQEYINILSTQFLTIGYSSPERIKGKYDFRTDLWSLGAILYEMITLQPMFDGNNSKKIYNIVHFKYDKKPLKEMNQLFRDVIQNTVVVDPRKRWETQKILQIIKNYEEQLQYKKEISSTDHSTKVKTILSEVDTKKLELHNFH